MQKYLQTTIPFQITSKTLLNSDLIKKDYTIYNGRLIKVNTDIYLQSSGTQYIDTGVYGSGNTTLDFKFDMSATTNSSMLFGSRQAYWNRSFIIFAPIVYRFDYGNNCPGNITSKARFLTEIDDNNYNCTLYNFDGTIYDTLTSELKTFTTPDTLKLYAGSTAGVLSDLASAKVYYLKIYEEDVLVRHFVPVPQDLVIGNFTCPSNGMFDIVNQQFYANQGTGTFDYGKDN